MNPVGLTDTHHLKSRIKTMKRQLITGLLLLGTFTTARATLFFQGNLGSISTTLGTSQGSVVNSTIVDGNPTYVTANTMTLSGLGSSLSSLTLSLNITGGNNSGLYAYLVHGSTTLTLMNQPGVGINGFGATGAGMNISLLDGASDHGAIQSETSSSFLTGSYNAASSLAGFNSAGDPNGAWTLYFGDTISGGGNATILGWGLDVTAVPEPVNMALGVFAVVLAGTVGIRRFQAKRRVTVF